MNANKRRGGCISGTEVGHELDIGGSLAAVIKIGAEWDRGELKEADKKKLARIGAELEKVDEKKLAKIGRKDIGRELSEIDAKKLARIVSSLKAVGAEKVAEVIMGITGKKIGASREK